MGVSSSRREWRNGSVMDTLISAVVVRMLLTHFGLRVTSMT